MTMFRFNFLNDDNKNREKKNRKYPVWKMFAAKITIIKIQKRYINKYIVFEGRHLFPRRIYIGIFI